MGRLLEPVALAAPPINKFKSLPDAIVNEREYPDTDLEIQFSESNISFVDTIIRPWVQMYSIHGNFDDIYLTSLERPFDRGDLFLSQYVISVTKF